MTDLIREFFSRIDSLEKKQRIQLKRSCGSMLNEADAETLSVFYRVLPYQVRYDEDKYFVAACIHCLWDAEEEGRKPMEKAISLLKNNDEFSASLEKRLIGLLETQWDEDGYLNKKLGRMAKLLKQKGYAVDGAELLDSLLAWNRDDKYIQKKWIKVYYNTTNIDE